MIKWIRKFNLLLKGNFKKEHEMQFYAGALNKSPKTMANVFAMARGTFLFYDFFMSFSDNTKVQLKNGQHNDDCSQRLGDCS